MPHRITNESARQMYGLDLMLQELLIKKDFVVQMVRLSRVLKDENILKFKETMLSYIWQKNVCLSTSTIIYSKLPIINEETKVLGTIQNLSNFSYH